MSVKNKILVLCIFIFLVLVIVCWQINSKNTPSEISSLYSSYMNMIMFDYEQAANKYCHFEISNTEQMFRQSQDFVTDYQILKWSKINEKLWSVQTSFRTCSMSSDDVMFNFVGEIQGRYFVMINAFQVPTSLYENFRPFQYVPADVVPYQDVVGMLE